MWPFSQRSKTPFDHLTHEVELAGRGPFHEVERYLIVWPDALAQSYGLAIVYQGRKRNRVHVVHSPGYKHSGSMENFGEWIATAVRLRDPNAAALFLSWPPDRSAGQMQKPELMRVWFALNPSGIAARSKTVLMSEAADGATELDNVFTKSGECLYKDMTYGHPRHSPDYWANILGCPIPTFTGEAWVAAADEVDPGGVQRRAVEVATEDALKGQIAWMKEMGVYGDEQGGEDPLDDVAAEPAEPSPAQRARLERCWAKEPDAVTVLVGNYGLGGANNGNPHHSAPVVTLFLTPDALAEMPLDPADFKGTEETPPQGRRIRLWDETLLSVEEVGRWRFVVYMDENFFPPWWFEAASAPLSERPYAVLALNLREAGPQLDGVPQNLLDLGELVGLAHLEDCRSLE